MTYDWHAEAKRAHDIIEAEHRKTFAMRLCPSCGKDLKLGQLRTSKRWTYSHVAISECALNRLGSAVKFMTEQEAREAVIIFNKQENPVDPVKPS